MTGYGKRGKPNTGFPSLPTALGNRSARFPHFHRLGCGLCLYQSKQHKNKGARPTALLQAHRSMRICSTSRPVKWDIRMENSVNGSKNSRISLTAPETRRIIEIPWYYQNLSRASLGVPVEGAAALLFRILVKYAWILSTSSIIQTSGIQPAV